MTEPTWATRLVVFAASAGGVQALRTVVAALPADFPAAVVIVLHVSPDRESLLAELLAWVTPLRVRQAAEGDVLRAGRVFTAPPGRHVVVNADRTLSLSLAPKVHFSRPSAEPLFASAARVYGDAAVAVVLTGGDGDGSTGVKLIQAAGGTVLAQDEATSECFSMPMSAIATGCVDAVLPLDRIGPALVRLMGVGAMP